MFFFQFRLRENVQNTSNKSAALRPNEYESAIVSRSPSIASLPLGQNKCHLSSFEHSMTSILSVSHLLDHSLDYVIVNFLIIIYPSKLMDKLYQFNPFNKDRLVMITIT